jgi:hypothetical protein
MHPFLISVNRLEQIILERKAKCRFYKKTQNAHYKTYPDGHYIVRRFARSSFFDSF